jgi:hypothetical protein
MFWLQLFGGIDGGIDGINAKLHSRRLDCLFTSPLKSVVVLIMKYVDVVLNIVLCKVLWYQMKRQCIR